MVSFSYAQDVIVLHDGNTIVSKVLEITKSDIKYKKYDNIDGPSYSLNRSAVQKINYENGSVEEIADIDMKIGSLKKAKTLKIMSYIIGGGAVIAGGLMAAKATSDRNSKKINDDDYNSRTGWGVALMGVGVASWAIFYFSGRNIEKKAQRYNVNSLAEKEFKLNNGTALSASIDVFNDRQSSNKQLGLGVRYSF